MRKRRMLLAAPLAVLAAVVMAAGALASSPEDDVIPGSTVPNNARHDAEKWNPGSLMSFEDIGGGCSVGLGWEWDGHTSNEWMLTAGHCLPYNQGANETDIDGPGWYSEVEGYCSQPSAYCSYPSARNSWGYYSDDGSKTSMWVDNANGGLVKQILNSACSNVCGDVAIFRVDKEQSATKNYVGLTAKLPLGPKFTPTDDPQNPPYYSDICVWSARMEAESCGWNVLDMDSSNYSPSGAQISHLSVLERPVNGTCAIEEGDSGTLIYYKDLDPTTQTERARPVGIVSGFSQPSIGDCADLPFRYERIYFTSIGMIQNFLPGNVHN